MCAIFQLVLRVFLLKLVINVWWTWKGNNHIYVKTGHIYIIRINQELLEESDKSTRTLSEKAFPASLENFLSIRSLPEGVKIGFFKQASCIEGMGNESRLTDKKNGNLEMTILRLSTRVNSSVFFRILLLKSDTHFEIKSKFTKKIFVLWKKFDLFLIIYH